MVQLSIIEQVVICDKVSKSALWNVEYQAKPIKLVNIIHDKKNSVDQYFVSEQDNYLEN